MFDYDDAAATLILHYEQDNSDMVRKNTVISFQNISALYYKLAGECEHTGSGPEFREKYLKSASYSAAIARHILTRD